MPHFRFYEGSLNDFIYILYHRIREVTLYRRKYEIHKERTSWYIYDNQSNQIVTNLNHNIKK